jgi:hypothetical protein
MIIISDEPNDLQTTNKAQGWELVSIVPDLKKPIWHYWFKSPEGDWK